MANVNTKGLNRTATNARIKIKKEEERLGRKLTKDEKRAIIKKERKKIRIALFFGLTAVLGVGIGAAGTLLPGAGEQVQTEVEAQPNEWKESLKVDSKEYIDNAIEDEVNEIINGIPNRSEGLKFAKDIYIKAYNEKNHTNLTSDSITLEQLNRRWWSI